MPDASARKAPAGFGKGSLLIAALCVLSHGCSSSSGTAMNASGGGAAARGDPDPDKVSCVGAICDLAQGQKCCLWLEGNPIVEKGACLLDCSNATPSPGTAVDEITCDGSEDCAGSACCDGKCSSQAQCLPGPEQYCHDATQCPMASGCCSPLFVGAARFGACEPTPQSGCSWP
jgi:hypothetical protein